MANRFSRLGFALVCALVWQITVALDAATREPCGIPQTEGDWPVETQVKVNIDPQRLCDLVDRLAVLDANIHSVLIVREGKLVFEHYRPGFDQKWGIGLVSTAQGPNIKHDVRSVTKSVISLLMGIVFDRKLISDLDKPVFEFFPEYAAGRTPAKDRVMLRHLLSTSSGIEWDENRPYNSARNSEVWR